MLLHVRACASGVSNLSWNLRFLLLLLLDITKMCGTKDDYSSLRVFVRNLHSSDLKWGKNTLRHLDVQHPKTQISFPSSLRETEYLSFLCFLLVGTVFFVYSSPIWCLLIYTSSQEWSWIIRRPSSTTWAPATCRLCRNWTWTSASRSRAAGPCEVVKSARAYWSPFIASRRGDFGTLRTELGVYTYIP